MSSMSRIRWIAAASVFGLLVTTTSFAGANPKPKAPTSFVKTALQLSTTHSPADMLAEAARISETVPDRQIYEKLGQQLLSAARSARFAEAWDSALSYLDAADHAFDMAELQAGEPSPLFFAQRAIVAIEQVLVTDSEERWSDAAHWLEIHSHKKLPSAAWARRILSSPPQYAAADRLPEGRHLPVHVSGDVTRPIKIFSPAPNYPEEARTARIQGVVIMQVIIDHHGNVVEPKILKDLPMGIGQAAKDAVSTWIFEPATLNDRPIDVYYNLTVNFRLDH